MALPPVYERRRPDWYTQAKCLGSCGHNNANLFFADHQHNGQVNEAKSVCLGTHPDFPGQCPVLDQCLDYALNNGEKWGVWGGCSERERRRIKRERHREAALNAGKIVSINTATSRDRRQLARIVRNKQARDPAPWRHSKGLIDQRRRLRATAGCAAPFGDVAFGMVSEG
jgi:WhiB family redox-sensing transcriptional regulator